MRLLRLATCLLCLLRRYELPSEYSVLMLQYRHGGENCVPRLFLPGNMSRLSRAS